MMLHVRWSLFVVCCSLLVGVVDVEVFVCWLRVDRSSLLVVGWLLCIACCLLCVAGC